MEKTVFIVADNDAKLAEFAAALEAEFRVLTMPAVERMFFLLNKILPDVILLEATAPEQAGLDVLTGLRDNPKWKNIPVVLIYNRTDDKITSVTDETGFTDVLSNPENTELRNCVRKHTGSEVAPSVLVVDDQETNIKILVDILSSGYTVYEAENGQIAIKEAKKYAPDVILLDILMPEMDGYAAIEILRNTESTKEIPIIFVTSLKGHDDEERGLISGAADYITKPFNPATVKLRVQNQMRIINHARSLDERLRQQELLMKISHSFLSDDRAESLLTDTLRLVGEFLGLARVLLYMIEDGRINECRSEWLSPELHLESSLGVDTEGNDGFNLLIKKLLADSEHYYISSNDPACREAMQLYRGEYNNYITSPIFIKGKICAVLDFSREDDGRQWSDSELNFIVLLSDIISGVFERDAIEYDLNVVLKLKEDLNIAKEQTERLSRAKSEFLSRMSHEMLTPMNAIIGMTQVAKLSKSVDGVKSCLDEIGTASKHMVMLIKNILDVSEEGTMVLEKTSFVFSSMLEYISSVINPIIMKKSQTLVIDISQSVPEVIFGDEKRITQVIVHLLSNASKFTPENGEIHFNACVHSDENESITLRFEVADNGIGISKEQQNIIFNTFEQMDNSVTRKYGGVGIGLALSKLIVDMMGGKISLESELGKGAKFSFTCNVLKGRNEHINESRDISPAYSVETGAIIAVDNEQPDDGRMDNMLAGKRILVVDDVATNRKVVGGLVKQKGAEVIEAKDGKEALEIYVIESDSIDLILMDTAMPDMDGYEAAQKIRASGLQNAMDIPIIALSAYTDGMHMESSSTSGIDYHLEKPIEPQVLYTILGRYLN